MANYVETSGIQGGASSTANTASHTTGGSVGADAIFAIIVYFGDSVATINDVTVDDGGGAVSATHIVTTANTGGSHDVSLWVFTGVSASTSYDIVTDLAASAEHWIEGVVLDDVDQTSPVRDSDSDFIAGGTGTIAGTVTSDTGDVVVGGQAGNGTTAWTKQNSQIEISQDLSSDVKESGRLAGASPNVTMGWSNPALVVGSMVLASFQSPSGGGTSATISDGLTLGDDVGANAEASVSDGLVLGDEATIPDDAVSASDGIILGDEAGANAEVSLTDGIQFGEDFDIAWVTDSGPDGILFGDNAERDSILTAGVSEGMVLSDSPASTLEQAARSVSEGMVLGDSLSESFDSGERSLSEGLVLGDRLRYLGDYVGSHIGRLRRRFFRR